MVRIGVFLGPPGSGKGTIAGELEKTGVFTHVSTGNIFREAIQAKTSLGLEVEKYLDSGQLVPDKLTNEVLQAHLLKNKTTKVFLLDGYPRTTEQAISLKEFLDSHKWHLQAAINFEIDNENVIKRVSKRRVCPLCKRTYHLVNYPPKKPNYCDFCHVGLVNRKDDDPKIVKQRLISYEKKSLPLVNYYAKHNQLKTIDAVLPVLENVTKIKQIFSSGENEW